ncbi:YkgJ family cysteine cluster protein [Pseudomonadota bacterium]
MQACNQCGKCCLEYKGGSWLGSASDQDKLFWQVLRPDVLEYLGQESEFWFSPVTGKKLGRCPWLRKLPNQDKYNCRIHELRPEVCRNFPVDIEQMIQVNCEMLEEGDLDQPHAQLTIKLAQL